MDVEHHAYGSEQTEINKENNIIFIRIIWSYW